MSHGLDLGGPAEAALPTVAVVPPSVAAIERFVSGLNRVIILASQIALILAACILSYSVVIRYFLKEPTYWQDEASVFLLVGATFLSAAYVQERRGHIGIEALMGMLSPKVEAWRRILVDIASFAFCAFFAWKSWTLFHEAWVDGQVSSSTWAPPLWIPYVTMSVGMTLLTLQILLQVIKGLTGRRAP